jgi:hypothetical protein
LPGHDRGGQPGRPPRLFRARPRAGTLITPPRLMIINRGGHPYSPTLVNILTVAVALQWPPQLIRINQGGFVTVPTSVKAYLYNQPSPSPSSPRLLFHF